MARRFCRSSVQEQWKRCLKEKNNDVDVLLGVARGAEPSENAQRAARLRISGRGEARGTPRPRCILAESPVSRRTTARSIVPPINRLLARTKSIRRPILVQLLSKSPVRRWALWELRESFHHCHPLPTDQDDVLSAWTATGGALAT